MIQETPNGQTNYCTHRDDSDVAKCSVCLGKDISTNFYQVGQIVKCGHCSSDFVTADCDCVCHKDTELKETYDNAVEKATIKYHSTFVKEGLAINFTHDQIDFLWDWINTLAEEQVNKKMK